MKLLEDSTRIGNRDCIKLVPRTFEKTYILIYSGFGCSSFIGKIAPGAQPLSIGTDCFVQATIAHEFIHALGVHPFFIYMFYPDFYFNFIKEIIIIDNIIILTFQMTLFINVISYLEIKNIIYVLMFLP